MNPAYDDAFFGELVEFLPHLDHAQFKGGEPFLATENRRVWDALLASKSTCSVGVTTNGTIWNESVEHYLRALKMDVSVSVDAVNSDVLEQVRVGVRAEQLWRNIDRFQAVTEQLGTRLTLVFCLIADNWQELGRFLAETMRRGVTPSVIWVDGPARFNLLTIPHISLAEVSRALHEEDAIRRDLPGIARPIWRDALSRVDAALAQSKSSVFVSLRGPHAERLRDDALLNQLARTLEEMSGEDPFVVTYHDGVATSVESPDWAGWLMAQEWEGSGLEMAMTILASSAGSTVRSEVESLERGVHAVTLEFGQGDSASSLRGFYVPFSSDPSRAHILLAPSSPSQTSTQPPDGAAPASEPI